MTEVRLGMAAVPLGVVTVPLSMAAAVFEMAVGPGGVRAAELAVASAAAPDWEKQGWSSNNTGKVRESTALLRPISHCDGRVGSLSAYSFGFPAPTVFLLKVVIRSCLILCASRGHRPQIEIASPSPFRVSRSNLVPFGVRHDRSRVISGVLSFSLWRGKKVRKNATRSRPHASMPSDFALFATTLIDFASSCFYLLSFYCFTSS